MESDLNADAVGGVASVHDFMIFMILGIFKANMQWSKTRVFNSQVGRVELSEEEQSQQCTIEAYS